jgi:hypothetical protein
LRFRGGGGGLAPSSRLDEPPSELELEPFAEPAVFPEPPELLPEALELLPDVDRAARVRALAPERGPESDFGFASCFFVSCIDDEPLPAPFVATSA